MSETLADRYRDEFPVKREHIYFNHAGVCPLPRRVAAAAQGVFEQQMETGGAKYERWLRGIHEARQSLAKLTRAGSEEIAVVKNTTHGLMIAAGSIPFEAGDNVVTTAIEFPANVYPWLGLERYGVETRFVGARNGRILVDDLRAAMDRRTRAIAVSWVQFTSGFRIDLGKLSQLCRDKNCYLVVDAIQGLGALQIDLGRYSIDFLAADGHKWMLSAEGAGVLYVRRQILGELQPHALGWLGMEDPFDFLNYNIRPVAEARRFEEGSQNVAGIHALGAAAGLFLEAGPAQVESEVLALTDSLCERLQSIGCEITAPRGEQEKSGIVTFKHERAEAKTLAERLTAEGVECVERGGAVRFSPHFYNDADEVERAVDIVRRNVAG